MLHKHITISIECRRKGRKLPTILIHFKKSIFISLYSLQALRHTYNFTVLKSSRAIILYSTYAFSIHIKAEVFPTLFQNFPLLWLRHGSAHFQPRPGFGLCPGPRRVMEMALGGAPASFASHYVLIYPCGEMSQLLIHFNLWNSSKYEYTTVYISREESEQMGRGDSAKGNDSILNTWSKDSILNTWCLWKLPTRVLLWSWGKIGSIR